MKYLLYLTLVITAAAPAWAKVDLVTLPVRDKVQLTIYNSADLTLARDSRALTLRQGDNDLQFSWANTLIDPTSLELLPLAQTDKIDVQDLVFAPRIREAGLWHIKSGVGGKVPVEITYLTSGLSWRAFYLGTLAPDEKTMRLEGYVRVTNGSGEDYENAQVRLIVGQVHTIDEIAALARREQPYGRPGERVVVDKGELRAGRTVLRMGVELAAPMAERPKEIVKEGLSEYFLYTIEGTETVRHGWSKRLQSFTAEDVPVVNLYKHEPERYGPAVARFLSFKNDTDHKLGQTPIPNGTLKVYRRVDDARHLSYEGQSGFKYIPVNEEVELNLGPVSNVVVEEKLMAYRTENYQFNARLGDISGWDEIRQFAVKVKNTRDVAVKVELQRNFPTTYAELSKAGDFGQYEKVDKDTVKFTLDLPPRSQKEFTYDLHTYHGDREQAWRP